MYSSVEVSKSDIENLQQYLSKIPSTHKDLVTPTLYVFKGPYFSTEVGSRVLPTATSLQTLASKEITLCHSHQHKWPLEIIHIPRRMKFL